MLHSGNNDAICSEVNVSEHGISQHDFKFSDMDKTCTFQELYGVGNKMTRERLEKAQI